MNFYIPFGIIVVLLLYWFRKNNKKANRIFFWTMVVAFMGAAIRYEFGPDYFSYRILFDELHSYGAASYVTYEGHSEPLFAYYMAAFPSYTLFLAFNSFLWFGIYYLFYKKYTDYKYYWFLVFFLFFNTDCILNSLVAMRQAVAAYLFIIAFYALVHDRKILFLLMVALCTSVHTSCIVMVPLVFVNKKSESIFFSRFYLTVIVVAAIAFVFLGRDTFLVSVSTFLVNNVDELQRYMSYIERMGLTKMDFVSIFKYVILLLMQIIPLYYQIIGGRKETDGNWIVIYKFGIIISTLGILLGHGIFSRYFMIFNPFYIASIIHTLSKRIDIKIGYAVFLSVAFYSVYTFYVYLQEDYCESFLQYHSILTAPTIP